MKFEPKPSDYLNLLEVFRFGIIHGVIEKEHIVKWADGIIKATSQPTYFFIELSLSKSNNEIIEAIGNIDGVVPNVVTTRALFGIIYHDLVDGINKTNKITEMLDGLNNHYILSEFEVAWLYRLSDDHDRNTSTGVPIDAEEERLLDFLSTYKDLTIDNYRSWDEINERLQPLFNKVEEHIKEEHKKVVKAEKRDSIKKGINFIGVLLILLACLAVIIAVPFIDPTFGQTTFLKYELPAFLIIMILVRIGRFYINQDSTTPGMLKQFLRAEYLYKRQRLSDDEYNLLNQDLLLQFQQLDLTTVNCIHIFLPIIENNEINTYLLRDWLKQKHPHIRVIHPKTNFRTLTMKSYAYDDDLRIETSRYGIPEPTFGNEVEIGEIDMIILPMLIFDELGYRVGYGKGFYDRFCALCKPRTKFIGISLFEPVKSIEDVNQYDVWMHSCLTPAKRWDWH